MVTAAEKKTFDRIVQKIDILRHELDMHVSGEETIHTCHQKRAHPFAIEPVPTAMAKVLEPLIEESGIGWKRLNQIKAATGPFPHMTGGYEYDTYYLKAHGVGIGKLKALEGLVDDKITKVLVEKVAANITSRHAGSNDRVEAFNAFTAMLAEALGHPAREQTSHVARLAKGGPKTPSTGR